VDDVEIAILNCQDAMDEARAGFPPNSRSVIVFANDLKVLIEAARKGMNGKGH
jgi:hypothetical protein